MGTVGAVVVCAAFDPALDAAVLERVGRLAAAGLPVRTQPAHRPHLTLAAVPPSVDVARVVDVVARLAVGRPAVPVRLTRPGAFATGVVWLAPEPSPALEALQADVDAAMAERGWPRAFADRDAPTSWVAHCTLARRLAPEQVRLALSVLAADDGPSGRVDALATILVGGRGDVALARLGGGCDR